MTVTRCAAGLVIALWLSAATASATIAVYGDGLASGWQDWSWGGVTRDFARATPAHSGAASIAVTYTGGWSGMQLGRNDAVDTTGFDVLRCWMHGGTAGGQQIQIEVGNHLSGVSTRRSVTPAAGAWTQVDVALAPLGTAQVTYVYWFNNSAGAQATFYVDDVAFVASGNPTPTPVGPMAGPALRVDVGSARHPISPYIYGMNFADEGLAAELRLPVRRWGGNATTRYNWQTDTSNHASDWYFENIPNDNANPAALPDGSSSDSSSNRTCAPGRPRCSPSRSSAGRRTAVRTAAGSASPNTARNNPSIPGAPTAATECGATAARSPATIHTTSATPSRRRSCRTGCDI
jgi:hypothetical protein